MKRVLLRILRAGDLCPKCRWAAVRPSRKRTVLDYSYGPLSSFHFAAFPVAVVSIGFPKLTQKHPSMLVQTNCWHQFARFQPRWAFLITVNNISTPTANEIFFPTTMLFISARASSFVDSCSGS